MKKTYIQPAIEINETLLVTSCLQTASGVDENGNPIITPGGDEPPSGGDPDANKSSLWDDDFAYN